MNIFRIVVYLLVSMFACAYSAAESDKLNDWQMRRLFHPSPAELESEARGTIFIYDGLKDKTVERVLDEEFERIGSMMFVGTIVTDDSAEPLRDWETGQYILEDDGCD